MARVEDRPRYYFVKRNGRAFWGPGSFAAEYGLPKSRALGLDSIEARRKAMEWNKRLDDARKRTGPVERPKTHRPGTLGSFYERFQETEAWGQMEPGTRNDYVRAWPIIEKRFGDVLVTKITPDDSERFHVDIHPRHDNRRDPKGEMKLGWNTAHRVLKVWRSLLVALVKYKLVAPPAPTGRVTNPAPPGRSEVWIYDEVVALIEGAHQIGMPGMAVAIRLGWDAMLSPVDVRRFKIGGWRPAAGGGEIATRRKKTGKAVRGAVTDDADTAIGEYLAALKAKKRSIGEDEPLIRNPAGVPYTGANGHKYFQRDFAKVRAHVFPRDMRQFLDIRRSAATEARHGGATDADIGSAMANMLGKDAKLQSTYLVSASRRVQDARAIGRSKMVDAFRNAPDSVPK